MQDVLILNRNYFAVQIADWQDVMSLLYREHAVVIDKDYNTYNFDQWREISEMMEESPGGFVHTETFKIKIPDVISLLKYDKVPHKQAKFNRKTLYSQYNNTCCYCNKKFHSKDINLDHVLPRCKGGKSEWKNVVVSCIKCNSKKNDMTPKEAGMTMHYQPYEPKWNPQKALVVNTGLKIRESWQSFINKIYWNAEIEP